MYRQQHSVSRRAAALLHGGMILALCLSLGVSARAADSSSAWQPGVTFMPYGWLAGVKGSMGAPSDGIDSDGGLMLPLRIDVSVDDQLDQIGFMFFGEWRGERWMAAFDSVWANVSQAADIKLVEILPESSAEGTIDGNIYQAVVGYRVQDWSNSTLTAYGGLRFYDLEAIIALQGGILPRPLEARTTKRWTDAVIGGRWNTVFNDKWRGFVLADIGVGESDSSWQVFGGVSYRFSWASLQMGYRYMSLDYNTVDYEVDLSLSGPALGLAFRF